MAIEVTIAPDKRTFRMAGEFWSQVLPVADLSAQIAFYRGLQKRKNGQFASFFTPTVKALIKAQMELI